MAIDTGDFITAVDSLAEKLLSRIIALQEQTQMEDEQLATVISGTITSSVEGGIKIVEVLKSNALTEQKIAESESLITIREEKNTAEIALITRQQEALDDARNVKTAELIGNTISLIESGGTSAPTEIWTALKNATNKIAYDELDPVYPEPAP